MSPSKHASFVPALEGLRGLAVLMVIVDHTSAHEPAVWHVLGASGVGIFFCLSGYLISGVLLKIQLPRYRHLPRFYSDRAVRLVPMLLMVCAFVTYMLYTTGKDPSYIFKTVFRSLFYIENTAWWHTGNNFLHQTWSLSVEEQFYITWSILLPLIAKCPSHSRAVILGSIVSFSMLAQYRIVAFKGSFLGLEGQTQAYEALLPNYWKLVIGSLPHLFELPKWLFRSQTSYIGLFAIFAVLSMEFASQDQCFRFRGSGLVTVAAFFTILGAAGGGNTVLEWKWLRFIGRFSYAWYLWSASVQYNDGTYWKRKEGLYSCSVALLISLATTTLVEDPIREWYKLYKQARDTRDAATSHDELGETESLLPICRAMDGYAYLEEKR